MGDNKLLNPRAVYSGGVVLNQLLTHNVYLIRRKFFKLFGGAFHIYDPAGQLVLYSELKAFKLKEDIRVFTGEDMRTEVMSIKARQMLDISATYDVHDSSTGEKVGALRRKGLKSMLKDEWLFLDPQDQETGIIREDNWLLAIIRRLITPLIPQKYSGEIRGTPVCTIRQNFNPFVQKVTLDFSADTNRLLDRRLGIAAAILLNAIEKRQN